MSDLHITDQSSNHRYRTELPNIIFELELSSSEFMLYSAIKKCAGDHGHCTKSLENLAKMCNSSSRNVIRCLKKLALTNPILRKPLIKICSRNSEHGDKDTNLITIVDIWPENYRTFGGYDNLSPPTDNLSQGHDKNDRGVMTICHQGYDKLSYKEEPFKKNTKEEEQNIARSATSLPPSKKNTLQFDFNLNKFIGIEKEDLEAWKEIYPEINLGSEILKAIEWLKSNPTKSHKKNWRKFLTGWFNRSNEKTENKKAYRSGAKEIDRRTQNIDGTPIANGAKGRF